MILQNKKSKISKIPRQLALIVAGFVLIVSTWVSTSVYANRLEQIQQIKNENAVKSEQRDQLGAQASSYEDQVNKLQIQIVAIQNQIVILENQKIEKEQAIVKAEAELASQKKLLGENIKTMYIEGKITTLEMLFTSNDLSDFVDKQEYRDVVKSKIKGTVDQITLLKNELKDQKVQLELLISDQQRLQTEANTQSGEVQRLLALTQAEKNAVNSQIKENSARISQLEAEQAAENARRFKGVTIVAGNNGNDTYPSKWRDAPMNAYVDTWGMFSRQCVSYTAWKVYESGRYMPNWGGYGNANQWDENAANAASRARGITIDNNPRPGDVAVSNAGPYGHVMYVESVNGNGTINISQYNYGYNGTYSEAYNMPTNGLVFIHFK